MNIRNLAKMVAAAACTSSLALGLASTNAGAQATRARALTPVTVAYVPLPLFEPLFVAMHDGYFAKNGIDVHLTVVGSGQSATTLAATNRVQVVLGGFSAGMFNAIHQGLDFKVVGSMAEEARGAAANGLVIAKSDWSSNPAKIAAALKGAKIAVDGGTGSTGAYLVARALATYHLHLSQVTLVNLAFPEMESALKSGGVTAAYLSTPFLGAALSGGVGKLVAGAPIGVPATGVIYGGSFAKTKTAQRFFDALVEASKKLQGKAANSKANLEIIAKATGESLSLLKAEPPNVFSPNLAPPVAVLAQMQRIYLANHNLDYSSPIPSSKYVDVAFAKSAS
ncbi:MAG: ABC transporter substrate-binding protein [Actinomycetota bacterium]|nr:ABC transporter substrate-binding protein [Actinomycetota bacterium]